MASLQPAEPVLSIGPNELGSEVAKLNAFDLVVTVALGSTLSTVLLSKTTPLS